MKSYVLFVALLQVLGCLGVPLQNPDLEAKADKALAAAMTEINSVYALGHLYRASMGSVTRVINTGLNTMDLMLALQVKETECLRNSGSDPQTCAFKTGFYVPTKSCSARVRMFPTSAQVISAKCGKTSSSSSESSEEMLGRSHFNIPSISKVLAPVPATPPAQSSRSLLHNPAADRGDTFNNRLE